MKKIWSGIFPFSLGIAFVTSIYILGNKYFEKYYVEYGYQLNIFRQVEGGFYLIYGLFGIVAIILFSIASKDLPLNLFEKIKTKILSIQVKRIVYLLAVMVFVIVLMLRIFLIAEAPMTDDENAYLLGAKILSQGKFYLEGYPTEIRPFLNNQFIVMEDKVFTQYCPGFMLLLALMLKLGIAVLLNPLLAGLGIIAVYLLGRDFSGSKWIGFCASILLLISPAYIFTSALLTSHPTAMICGAFGIWFIFRGSREGILWKIAIGTVFLGYMFLTRPLPTIVLGLIGIFMVFSAPQNTKKKFKMILISFIIALIFIGFLLIYFNLLTGSPFGTTYNKYSNIKTTNIGIFNLSQYLSGEWLELLSLPFLRFNFWLFGWPMSLLLIFFIPRGNVKKYLLPSIIGVWLIHTIWSIVGVNTTGAAHYFELLPMLAVSTVSGIFYLMDKKERIIPVATFNFLIYSVLLSLLLFFPWVTRNLNQLSIKNLTIYKIENYVKKPAIIFADPFIEYLEFIHGSITWTYYRKNNNPDLDDEILWLNNLGQQNRIAMNYFKGRNYYLINLRKEDSKKGKLVLLRIYPDSQK